MKITDLEQQKAARKDALDLPHTLTQRQVNAYIAETAALDVRISTARNAAATLAALGTNEPDTKWLNHLNTWRKIMCDELMARTTRCRDKASIEWQQNLMFSTRLVDFDLGSGSRHLGPIVDLSSTRIGELMAAAGYTPTDLHGPNGWRGGIKEVTKRIQTLTQERAAAQAALDDALMDDAARTKREAESDARRAVLNSLNLRYNSDGTAGYTAYDEHGDVRDPATLTPEQRAAFDRANAVEAAYQAARLAETVSI